MKTFNYLYAPKYITDNVYIANRALDVTHLGVEVIEYYAREDVSKDFFADLCNANPTDDLSLEIHYEDGWVKEFYNDNGKSKMLLERMETVDEKETVVL